MGLGVAEALNSLSRIILTSKRKARARKGLTRRGPWQEPCLPDATKTQRGWGGSRAGGHQPAEPSHLWEAPREDRGSPAQAGPHPIHCQSSGLGVVLAVGKQASTGKHWSVWDPGEAPRGEAPQVPCPPPPVMTAILPAPALHPPSRQSLGSALGRVEFPQLRSNAPGAELGDHKSSLGRKV